MRVNNLDLAVIGGALERGRADINTFAIHKRVDGDLNLSTGSPMFKAEVTHGDRSSTIAIDVAPSFGGQGLAPDPLQFMLAALGACYASTLATIAAMEGFSLRAVSVTAELDANVASVYEMGDAPLMERISVLVSVDADADDQTLDRWQTAARTKCPFVFTIANPIALTTRVQRLAISS